MKNNVVRHGPYRLFNQRSRIHAPVARRAHAESAVLAVYSCALMPKVGGQVPSVNRRGAVRSQRQRGGTVPMGIPVPARWLPRVRLLVQPQLALSTTDRARPRPPRSALTEVGAESMRLAISGRRRESVWRAEPAGASSVEAEVPRRRGGHRTADATFSNAHSQLFSDQCQVVAGALIRGSPPAAPCS